MFAEHLCRTVVAFRRSCARQHACRAALSRHALFRL